MDGPKITFIDKDHKYFLDNGKELESATNFISRFFEKFDKDYWSKYVAKRDGFTVKEVLTKWGDKSKDACDFGTLVHNYAESIIKKTIMPEPITRKEKMYFEAVDLFMTNESYEFFDAETIVGSPKLGIAGTIDGLSKKNNKIFLIDWKTNEKIDFQGYKDKRCNEPIIHLPDCKFTKYSLQLSLYRYILEKEYNYEVGGQKLIHLYPDGTYNKIDVDYLKDEIEHMLLFEGML